MGVTEKTVVTYTCDRCKFESVSGWERGGYANVSADFGVTGYDGATGGYKRKYWLCGLCAHELQRFVSNEPDPSVRSKIEKALETEYTRSWGRQGKDVLGVNWVKETLADILKELEEK